jgi:hypothetical protein
MTKEKIFIIFMENNMISLKKIYILLENKQYDKYWEQHGIKPEAGSIGFSEKEKKWYGWSHRAIYGFKVGDKVKEGDCAVGQDGIKVGFEVKNLDDAKKLAKAFAESVS